MTRDSRDYYNDFSTVYEAHRHEGYHKMLDDLEFSIIEPFTTNKDVLEAGCGTGLILRRSAEIANRAVGIDLSPGMLSLARDRGLEVFESGVNELPFEDQSFDTVYSFKVLAHVPDISGALKEMTRVTRPGGHLILEFYNPTSLRGLIKRLKPATRITETTHDEQVFTRFDTLADIRGYLPDEVELVGIRGVRVVTPAAVIHKIPGLHQLFRAAEFSLRSGPFARLAGFLVVILKRREI
jgi:ubiquinone/menaquinone biosynthesis C-methylase UbiE